MTEVERELKSTVGETSECWVGGALLESLDERGESQLEE